MSLPLPMLVAVLVVAAGCALTDVRTRRIPNTVTGPAILAGVALNAMYFGMSGLLQSVAGFMVTVAVLLAPFLLGGLGGGDVKMMGAIGAFLGPRLALWGLGIGMVLGGIFMMTHLALRGRLGEKLATTGRMVRTAVLGRTLTPLRAPAADPRAIRLPYGLPLALGTFAALALARFAEIG